MVISHAMANTGFISSVSIQGRIYGKESSITDAKHLRAILPLPAVLQVIDVLVNDIVIGFVCRAFPAVDGTFIGARPQTQALDIAHGLQSVVEKELDNKSEGAVAQMDIQSYCAGCPAGMQVAGGARVSKAYLCYCAAFATSSSSILEL